MLRKQNLVLTFASGDTIFQDETFWVFVNSFRKNVPNSDLVILTEVMSDEVEEALRAKEVEIVRVPPVEMHFLYRDRHLSFWRYLNDHGHKYKYVLTSDSRDVLFQSSPFDWADQWRDRFQHIKGHNSFLDHFVVLTAEGFKMSQSGFACVEHFEFQRDVPMPYLKDDKDKWVINGGVALGTPRAMQDYHFLVWIVTMKTIGRATDQATINWLFYYLDKDDAYSLSFPQHDNLCLTGEGVKEGAVEPILKYGRLFNPKNSLYCLVHQWDRLDYLKDDVLAQYRE